MENTITQAKPIEKATKKSAIIYLDCETMPGLTKPDPSEIKVPANYKNEDAIRKYQEENVEAEYLKQSFCPYQGRLLCVGIAINDDEPFCLTGSEKEILDSLKEVLTDQIAVEKIVAHNGMTFDFFWLYIKSIKYRIPYLRKTFDGSQRYLLEDTIKLAQGTKYGELTSADKLAKLIGVEGKGTITGKDVWPYYQTGRTEEIYEYCKHDVSMLREIHKRLTE